MLYSFCLISLFDFLCLLSLTVSKLQISLLEVYVKNFLFQSKDTFFTLFHSNLLQPGAFDFHSFCNNSKMAKQRINCNSYKIISKNK